MAKSNSTKSIKMDINKKIEKQSSGVENYWLKIVKILFLVLIFLSAFYLLTIAIVGNDSSDNKPVETAIQYEEILAGSSFTMRESEYLVVYYDFTDEELSELSSVITSYSYLEDSLKLYTVDMSNGFNSNYLTEDKSNKTPEVAEDLAINGPTLIKIKEGKVTEYIEELDSIIEYLK